MEEEKQNKPDTRSLDFMNSLYEEKMKHKQHRHEFVKQKIIFTIGLFSVGSLKTLGGAFNLDFSILLYFIPFVALAYDVYIFSEDFKVKRIGVFIKSCNVKCYDESNWENWLTETKNREKIAYIASLVLTIIALTASFIILLNAQNNIISVPSGLFWWILGSSLLTIIVFSYSINRRNKLLKQM